MRLLLLLAIAPLVVAATPIKDAETTKDVRCFLALSSVAASEDDSARMAGVIGAQYFLGRIDGRQPDLDLQASIAIEAQKLTETDLQSLLQSCGALMKSRGEAVKAIGNQMQQEEAQSSSSSS